MKEVRTLAKQTIIYGFGTIVPRFLNYGILTFFYTRIFEKSEYGIVTELYAWMVLLLVILTYGMETGFFRFAQDRKDYEKVYSTALFSLLITSSLFLILVNIFIKPVSDALKYSNNHDYIRMFAAIVAIDAFCAIPFARLRNDNKPLIFSIIKVTNVIVTIIAVIILLMIGPKLYETGPSWFRKIYNPAYGVGYVFLANLIGSAFTLLLLLPYIVRIKPVFETVLWKRMITYSFPLLIAGLSGSINDAIDKILLRRIIGNETGLETVGEYGAGYKIAVLMALYIQMFRFAAEPFFFERAKYEKAKETYAFVMKYFVITMLLIYLGINLYISGFQYIIGKSFREAIIVVPIVSMGYLLYGIYINHSIWYKLNDLTRYGIYITLIGTLVTILINILLIPAYGYMASAWAHVASYSVMLIMSFIFAQKHFRINYNMKGLIPYFIVAVGMIVFSRVFRYGSLAEELVINTFLILVFVLFTQYKDQTISIFLSKGTK
ncbi:MAG: Polysaccharide biosynthesis protein [Bacteroidetes bacterium ADurb.Bin145]|nr:MAG: Polysaccharide biosynthesis protein [Bacteroidetes bacterium ADurb.Bin145]